MAKRCWQTHCGPRWELATSAVVVFLGEGTPIGDCCHTDMLACGPPSLPEKAR